MSESKATIKELERRAEDANQAWKDACEATQSADDALEVATQEWIDAGNNLQAARAVRNKDSEEARIDAQIQQAEDDADPAP